MWNPFHTFTPTGTQAAVAAGQILQDNNVDVQGNIWSITTGVLSAASTAAPATSHLTRPVGENQADSRIVTTLTNVTVAGTWDIVLRRQDANNFYLVQLSIPGFTVGAAAIVLYKYQTGFAQIGTSQFFTAVSGHNYTFDGSVLGTTLASTVTDTTSSTVLVNNYNQVDAAITASGQYALSSNGVSGSITQVVYYNQVATGLPFTNRYLG